MEDIFDLLATDLYSFGDHSLPIFMICLLLEFPKSWVLLRFPGFRFNMGSRESSFAQ